MPLIWDLFLKRTRLLFVLMFAGGGINHQIPTFRECLSRNGYFAQPLRRIRILILEILKYIPAVKILIFLDLERNISFLDGH